MPYDDEQRRRDMIADQQRQALRQQEMMLEQQRQAARLEQERQAQRREDIRRDDFRHEQRRDDIRHEEDRREEDRRRDEEERRRQEDQRRWIEILARGSGGTPQDRQPVHGSPGTEAESRTAGSEMPKLGRIALVSGLLLLGRLGVEYFRKRKPEK
jgi:hypothetical protein